MPNAEQRAKLRRWRNIKDKISGYGILGNREVALRTAIDLLRSPDFTVLRVSSVYETEPMDVPGQPWFLNLVLEAETSLFPRQLLARAARIERELGRRRTTPKGPRSIDIDILLYGRAVVDAPDLVIPHPRLAQRARHLPGSGGRKG